MLIRGILSAKTLLPSCAKKDLFKQTDVVFARYKQSYIMRHIGCVSDSRLKSFDVTARHRKCEGKFPIPNYCAKKNPIKVRQPPMKRIIAINY